MRHFRIMQQHCKLTDKIKEQGCTMFEVGMPHHRVSR